MRNQSEEVDRETLHLKLDRMRDREAATRDILQVMSQSRDDEVVVFQAILKQAERLCGADGSGLQLLNDAGTHLKIVAIGAWDEHGSFPIGTEFDLTDPLGMCLAVTEARVVHYEDLKETELYKQGHEGRRKLVDVEGVRVHLSVPLLQDGKAFGNITLSRRDPNPFSDDDIALVQTFAAQAVMAIENVRQFREVQERLEREAASAEILGVISQSRDDETPVFDMILENASRLCRAPLAFLSLANEERTHVLVPAYRGVRSEFSKILDDFAEPISRTELVAVRPIVDGKVVQMADITKDDVYTSGDKRRRQMADVEGARSVLAVPLVRSGQPVGAIVLYRREVAPFSENDTFLVKTFAAQAVIAIENVRQFRELQARLEREEATREVLYVISQSRDDEQPVFDLIVQRAKKLCGATFAGLVLGQEGDGFQRVAAHENLRPEVLQLWEDGKYPMERDTSLVANAILDCEVNVVRDMAATRYHRQGDERYKVVVTDSGIRSNLIVPLVRDGVGIGCLMLGRSEVRPYTTDEVALVESFAAQAVIAIENVRQFREVQQRLEREKATTDVLGVISRSRDDDLPVFDTILENAARLSGAPLANLCLANDARTHWRLVAHHGEGLRHLTAGQSVMPLDSNLVPGVTIRTAQVRHIEDLTDTDLYKSGDEGRVAMVEKEGMRTILGVPLLSGDVAIGCITLFRREVRAFTPDEIALVQTFAAQAVIAIENVRQFREVRERLRRERASSEVLKVISQSRDDEKPVFDAILANACALCDAPLAGLILGSSEDNAQTLAAHIGMFPEAIALFETGQMRMDGALSYAARSIIEGHLIAFADMGESDLYKAGSPVVRSMVDASNIRSVIFVPLISDGAGIGNLTLFRREVRPFNPSEISLVETFANQAVIAIENVQQFKALESLNAELGDRVEEQVGEIERMGRLKRFLPAAVADTVVSSGSDKMLSSHRAMLGVLFCDIRGFTAFCETAEPEETIEVLQTYHEEMGKLINTHGAGVDHRMGDGIMVLFNDPLPCEDPAGDAVRLAIAMHERMADLGKSWKRLGYRLGFGVGVSLGYATVGMVGFEGRFDYTASGTAINLAARLCDEAEDGEILLSPRAAIAVEDGFRIDTRGEINLKGIREPLEVFRLAGLAAN